MDTTLTPMMACLAIETGDKELFTIETVKERRKDACCPRRIADDHRWVRASMAWQKLQRVARNEQRICDIAWG